MAQKNCFICNKGNTDGGQLMVCNKCSENYVKGGVLFLERKSGKKFEFTGRHFVMRAEDYGLMFNDAEATGKMATAEPAEFERLRLYSEKMREGKIGKRIVFEKGNRITVEDTFDGSLRIEDRNNGAGLTIKKKDPRGIFERLLDRIRGK